jgi:hypothetical protein
MKASEIKLGIVIKYKPLGQWGRVVDFNFKDRDDGYLEKVVVRFSDNKNTVVRIKACSQEE